MDLKGTSVNIGDRNHSALPGGSLRGSQCVCLIAKEASFRSYIDSRHVFWFFWLGLAFYFYISEDYLLEQIAILSQ